MKQFLLALLTLFSFCCCKAQRIKYVVPGSGTVIKIIVQHKQEDFFGIDSDIAFFDSSFDRETLQSTDTAFVGIDSGFFKSNTEVVLVYLEKEGFISETRLVTLDEIRKSKKRFVLKPLERLPLRKNGDAHVVIEDVSFRLNPRDYSQYYYESYEDYKGDRFDHRSFSDQEILIKNSIFDKSLNHFLARTQHLDTTERLSLNSFDQVKIRIVVNTITEYRFGRLFLMKLNATVKVQSIFGSKKEVEKQFITFSDASYSDRKSRSNRIHIEAALEKVLLKMLADPELSVYFKNPQKELKKRNDSLPEIIINNLGAESPNLENATNAVVTVLQGGGHGSGCIISNDGYVVTNYHVAGQDTSNLYLIFNSGSKRRCRFIRSNPLYDLALLKVDTIISTPLKVNLTKTIAVGADVYAIGTPQNIDLGQSITKGIISAKRTIENKIYIQSDVSVNSGNSGGAMTNKDGELIGIVNAKLVGYGVEGVSFAIPAYYIEEFLRLKIKR